MGLLTCIILGIIVGWFRAALEEIDEGILFRMGLGAIGALAGQLTIVTISGTAAVTTITWLGSFASLLGAIVFISITLRLREYDANNRNLVR